MDQTRSHLHAATSGLPAVEKQYGIVPDAMAGQNRLVLAKRNASERVVFRLTPAVERMLIVLAVPGLYALLMHSYPIIYGGDPVARLVNFPRIMNGHQLPLLQVLIYCTMRWFYGPAAIFMLMSLISAAGCAGMHALAGELTQSRHAARLTALLYATHPFILYYSRVPYQEPLMLAGIAWGLYYLFRNPSFPNLLLSNLCFAMACFTRYEGWIAALAAASFLIRQNVRRDGRWKVLSVVQPLLLFGWAPVAWMVWNRGLSPAGSYVLDLRLHWERLYRSYFIVKSTLWWTGSCVTLLALIGFVHTWLDRELRSDERFRALLAIVGLLLIALVFSGHGIEPDAERIVTEREAFIPISLLVLYAGIGGSRLPGEFLKIRGGSLVGIAVVLLAVLVPAGYGLNRGMHRMAAANEDPDLKTDYQVSRFLADGQAAGLILAPPLSVEQMRDYLRNVEAWSGAEGKRKAEASLKGVEVTPLDYQRVLMFSWAGRDRVISSERLKGRSLERIEDFLRQRHVGYLVVFSGFTPAAQHEKLIISNFVKRSSPALEFSNGGRSALVYEIGEARDRGQDEEPSREK